MRRSTCAIRMEGACRRIGISSGPVVAGVAGTRKFFYDVWGDAVNVAARMESTGTAGKIQVSRKSWRPLRNAFVLKERGEIDVKGKGRMRTSYLVTRRAPAAAAPASSELATPLAPVSPAPLAASGFSDVAAGD